MTSLGFGSVRIHPSGSFKSIQWSSSLLVMIMIWLMAVSFANFQSSRRADLYNVQLEEANVRHMTHVSQQLSRFMQDARQEQTALRAEVATIQTDLEQKKAEAETLKRKLEEALDSIQKKDGEMSTVNELVTQLKDRLDVDDQLLSQSREEHHIASEKYERTERQLMDRLLKLEQASARIQKYQQHLVIDWGAVRDQVRDMTKWAWSNYAHKAWGQNEIKPGSGGFDNSLYKGASMGATILDGADTLLIMGLHDEYRAAREWVATELHFNHNMQVSTFETAIRVLGGLLSCFGLTHDYMYIEKSVDIADRLIKAISIKNGQFMSMGRFVHLTTGKAHGRAAIAEFGTLQLEFEYLSDITGDRTYRDIVYIIRDTMNAAKTDNFYGANFVAGAKKPFTGKVTMGGEVDSFYEYLLKGWILGGRVDEVQEKMYYDMADAFMDHNWVNKTSVGGFSYLKENATTNNLEHLACFAGGMYGLGAQYTTGDRVKQNSRYMDVAEQMTRTCHQGYINTKTGLAGEKWTMDTKTGNPLKPSKGGLEYILRPETIESYVYMYRYTKDEKYREWGLEYIEALNTHAKVEFGYDSVKNVWTDRREFMDNTPSFFFAETLKYLYLLYSDDDTIGFNDFVFNTEAHPIPIKGRPSRDTPRYSGFSVTPPIKFGQRAHSQEAPDVEQAANVNVNHFKPKNKVDLVQGDRQVKQEDVFNDEPIPEGVNDAAKQVKRAQLRAQAEAEAQNNQAQPPRAAVVLKWDKPAQEEEKLADNDDEGVDKEDAKEGDLANGDIADGEQDDNIAVQNAGLNKEGYADKNGDEVVDNDVGGVQKDFEADEDLTNEDVYALNKEIEQLRKDVKKL